MRIQRRKKHTGRGPVGKTAVVGAKDRATNQVAARLVTSTDKGDAARLRQGAHREKDATVYTDEARAYETLPFAYEAVKRSVSEYLGGQAHTNGVESFWAKLKCAHDGTFHRLSPKHPNRYVTEFAGKRDVCDSGTIVQMTALVAGRG